MGQRYENEDGVVTETRPKSHEQLKKPPMYRVILHNDNYTTRDFVVAVLREIFHRSEAEAVAIMLHVHTRGTGVAGVYTHDVAATKIQLTERLARASEFPLRLSMEPEDEES